MWKRRAAQFVAFGGVAGGLIGATMLGGGCGSSSNNGGPTFTSTSTTTESNTNSNSVSTTGSGTGSNTTTSSSSGTGTGSGTGTSTTTDAGDAGEAGPPLACNTLAILLDDAAVPVLYAFDDAGLGPTIGGQGSAWQGNTYADPLDAGLDVTVARNATAGDTCPGSLELTVPFTTQGQEGKALVYFTNLPATATSIHFSVALASINNDADGAVSAELTSGGGYINVGANWTYPEPDGAPPASQYGGTNAGSGNANVSGPNAAGYAGLPADGGWVNATIPIPQMDGGAGPTSVFLQQLALYAVGPKAPTDGAAPIVLPISATVNLLIDDVYVQ